MRKLLIAAFAVAAAFAVVLVAAPWDTAEANPPGAPEGKLAFKFNYIAATDSEVGCGNGHRIFTELGAGGQHILFLWEPGHKTHVEDCMTEAIDGSFAEVHADLQGVYTVFVRILGPNKAGNTLSICRNAPAGDHDDECYLGTANLDRKNGLDRFIFPKKLFDEGFVDELWHNEHGSNFRIAEVRLYLEP